MGVPKFYRWISERYPCLSEVVREHEIPEFDNLYLDMNGIIHVCSHPEDDNPHFRITQEKIFADIFHYIEVLFRLIKPKKVFFMAVDGVAPRAKMNQQRGRRFRSAKEAEKLEKKALEKGETLPKEARFDSNCITPGTEFMAKLQEQLKYFVAKKITTDKMWQGPRIYLSGHETPGEGEHKVMDFIRYEKSRPDYDHNTKHCLYGLDADLMMLGLSTHEPHFALLREEVRFGGKEAQKRSATVEETTFHLLHLTLFREYLDYEFSVLKSNLPFGYDLERIIDDWVFMGFLVGNDFIPHLPHLHIHMDALPLLWKTYKAVMPTLDGYLHDGGTLNLPRFEKFLKELAKYDFKVFVEQFDDLKYLEGKKGAEEAGGGKERASQSGGKAGKELANISRKRERASIGSLEAGIPTANEFMTFADDEIDSDDDLQKALGVMPLERWDEGIEGTDDLTTEEDLDQFLAEDFEDSESHELLVEFRRHKNAYYCDKMEYTRVTEAVLQEQAHGYVRALQWILHYYFNGVPSWSWFYPHHYAPYLSDVKNFAHLDIQFDLNKPFKPFEQLMAVLPSASKSLLPEPLQRLMVDDSSPILDFYPEHFEQDLNGKQQDWEAVVLIPFIEENRLLEAMGPLDKQMTQEERERNSHGPHTLFEYSDENQGTFQSNLPEAFPDIISHRAKITKVHQDLFRVEPRKLYKGLCKGVSLDVYFPGFPTLKHLEHTFYLEKAGVKVFQMNSRNENMILKLKKSGEEPETEKVARALIGRTVYAGWPHMAEVRVLAVSDGCFKYSIVEAAQKDKGTAPRLEKIDVKVEELSSDQATVWCKEAESIVDKYKDRRGVDIGEPDVLLYATPMTGRRYVCGREGKVSIEKQWSCMPIAYAYQACAKDIKVKEPEIKQYSEISDLFKPNSDVFMLGQPHYGCQGQVLEVNQKNEGRIRVNFINPQEPNLKQVINKSKSAQQYYRAYNVSQRLAVTSHLISRITGTVYVSLGSKNDALKNNQSGRTNVGFNLKFNKSNKEVPGFTKKDPHDNQWLYSQRCVDYLNEYIEEFPQLFDFLGSRSNEDNFLADDIFGKGNGESKLKEVKEYLKGAPFSKIEPAEHGTQILDDCTISLIEAEVAKVKKDNRRKRITMQVKPRLLFRPSDAGNHVVPDPTASYELFDRVVNVRDGFSVPLGLRGTVAGIRVAEKEQDVLYEIVFDEEFLGALSIRCQSKKMYRLPPSALINLSHGERKEQALGHHKPTAVVKPQYGIAATQEHPARQEAQQRGYDSQPTPAWGKGRPNGNAQGYNEGSYYQLQQSMGKYPYGSIQQYGVQPQVFYNQSHAYQHRAMRQGYNPTPRAPGQFVPNQAYRPQFQQPLQQPKQENSEFMNIWNQLQKSKDMPATWSRNESQAGSQQQQLQQQQQRYDPRPSLHIAAQALNQSGVYLAPQGGQWASKPGQGHSPEMRPQGIVSQSHPNQPQKIDLNTLFKSAKQERPNIENENIQELSSLMGALQIEERTELQMDPNQEGTQTLQQILKIGQEGQTGSIKPLMEMDLVKPEAPNYSKQVSVQELMQGGGMESHDQPKSANQNRPKHHRGQQPNQGKKSSMSELYNYCTSHGLTSPRYDYQSGRENKIVATVNIGGSLVFKGSYARDKHQATESAASVALFNFQQQAGLAGAGMAGPPAMFTPLKIQSRQQVDDVEDSARFAPSPNSAFTLVRGKGGYHGAGQHNDRRQHKQHQHRGQPFPNPPLRPNTAPQQAFLHTRQHGHGHFMQGHQGQMQMEFRGQGHQGQHPAEYRGHHRGHYNTPGDFKSHGAYSDLKRSHEFTQQKKGVRNSEETRSHDEMAKQEERSKTASKEQFVPLQVMKKQHTPRKEGSQESGTGQETDSEGQANQEQFKTGRNATAKGFESSGHSTSAKGTSSQTHQNNKSNREQKRETAGSGARRKTPEKTNYQPQRPKSRIAAKFTGLTADS